MRASILGCIFLHRVGEVRGLEVGWWWWGEVEGSLGGIKSGMAIVRVCVKEASVQRSTGLIQVEWQES